MNKNIEDIIKEALENHDAGYVSGAWESMSARLDGTPSTPFYKKWWVAAAFGTALVGTAAFFMMNETKNPDKKTQEIVAVNTYNQLSPSTEKSGNTPSGKGTNSVAQQTNPNTENLFNSSKESSSYSGSSSAASGNLPNRNLNASQVKDRSSDMIGNEIEKLPNRTEQTEFAKVILPAGVCVNEDLTISNQNASKFITVTDINGKAIDLAPGKKVTLTPKSAGVITVQSGDHMDVVTVHDNKSDLYIDVDPSLLYENGIPTLKFKVAGNPANLVWNSNIKDNEMKGDTYIVHPYTERSVEIRVSNTNDFGCKVEEKQVVTLDERYNLLAPTAFDPMSSDPRNKTFMPYALTERSVAFEMLIIDPRTGAKIYSTTDSSEGWTGIDQRTNEMVKSASVWAWKVIIKNPNTGEPREYSGTITKL